jgi:iron complex outermembrane receptor protein
MQGFFCVYCARDWFRRRRAFVLLVAVLLLRPAIAGAQQAPHCVVLGHVTDPRGGVLPGVTVTVSGPALRRPVTGITTQTGEYRLEPLPAGTYSVEYELSGFEPLRREGIVLTAGSTTTVNVVLSFESPSQPNERIRYEETVLVTAQRRAEDVREVPISVTAFTSSEIEEAGIRKPADFIALVPNIFMAESFTVGSSLIMSRGVAQTHNGSPPLAVVVDGVYQGNQKQFNQELFDIDRIELLKGPEGALYGRNSIGGAVNILTKQPTERFTGEVRVGFGNGSGKSVAGAISGPLHAEDLLFRFAGSLKDNDGLIENVFLRTEADPYTDRTGRFQLRWRPRQQVSIDGRASASSSDGGAVLYSIFPTTGHANDFSFPPEENILGESERQLRDFSVRAAWTGTVATLTAVAGYSRVEETYRADADLSYPGGRIATPFGQLGQGQDLSVRLASQELRIGSPDAQRVRWIVGLYHLGTDRDLESQLFADTNGTIAGFVPLVRIAEHDDNSAWAWFGQTDLKPWTHWTFSASARYDRDERRQTDLATGTVRTTVFDALQPRVTASYAPGKGFMAYVNAGRGFRSGGYNAPTVSPDVFDKELSTNFEIGARSTLADKRVQLDGAVYFTRLRHAQYFRVDFASASQIIDNMNRVQISGVELTLHGRVVQGLEVYGALGFNDSSIEDFDGTDAFEGNQTPTNIRSMANAGVQYAKLLGRGIVGVFRADLGRRGGQYWMPDNLDVQDPVELLDLRCSFLRDQWSVVGWVRNLTNAKYYVEYGDAKWSGIISGDDIGWLGRPRSFGVEVGRKF